jgi:predicted tellurium resistance membrane protein TerC
MLTWLHDPHAWVALITLTALEIVLGIDNIIFIAIFVNKLPDKSRKLARTFGLGLAMLTRIGLLLSIVWIMKLTEPLITIMEFSLSGRDLILLGGGLFLITKSTSEIHDSLDISEEAQHNLKPASFISVIIQIALIDIIFSLDSVITAVGLAEQVSIMVIAIIIAVIIMMFAAKAISEFVDNNPTIKILALSFLILVGVALLGEGMHFHIPKGYIYFAMCYSLIVEMLNMRLRKNNKPVKLG